MHSLDSNEWLSLNGSSHLLQALMNWPSEREKLFSAEEQATFGRKPQSSLKHQLCPHLPHGRCTHGDSCWYSHSLQEQRAALEKRKSIAAARVCTVGTFVFGLADADASVDVTFIALPQERMDDKE